MASAVGKGKEDDLDQAYEILGVEEDADDKQIQSAYRKLSLKCHPDRNPDDPEATDKFDQITRIKDHLLDPVKRAELDRKRKAGRDLEERFAQQDEKRRKMCQDLEGREAAPAAGRPRPRDAPSAAELRKQSAQADYAARLLECKARIADLQKQKMAVLEQEDYIGAQALKLKVEELQQLAVNLEGRLNSLPTLEARIADLQKQKMALLEEEDYIGAHDLKLKLEELQSQLGLNLGGQLKSIPTPPRSASAANVVASSGSADKNPCKIEKGWSAGSAGGGAATSNPTSSFFPRPSKFLAVSKRMAKPSTSAGASSSSRDDVRDLGVAGSRIQLWSGSRSEQVETQRKVSGESSGAGWWGKLRSRLVGKVQEQVGGEDAAENVVGEEGQEQAEIQHHEKVKEEAADTQHLSDVDTGGELIDLVDEEGQEEVETQHHQKVQKGAAETQHHSDVETGGELIDQWQPSSTPGHVELKGAPELTLPDDLFGKLYPYQQAGVAWMARLWLDQKGGILADEMGLGKTVQVCALLTCARKSGASHALLLLPVTLLDQWAEEIRKWCPGWPVYVYYGSPNERDDALQQVRRANGGILLTSYGTVANSADLFHVQVCDEPAPRKYKRKRSSKSMRKKMFDDDDEDEFEEQNPLHEMPGGVTVEDGTSKSWDIVVCDEAHRMKNKGSLLGRRIRGVRARCRILLTGTPVQNALQDLWSVMDFAQPGLLGNHKAFMQKFGDPIKNGSFGGASTSEVELKKHLGKHLRQLIAPHLLRRTKLGVGLLAGEDEGADVDMDGEEDSVDASFAQMQKLPSKQETIIWLAPSPQQLNAYKKLLEGSDVIKDARRAKKLGMDVLGAISILKRLCNHPSLLLPFGAKDAWFDYLGQISGEARGPSSSKVSNTSGDARDIADLSGFVVPSETKAFVESDCSVEKLLDPNLDDNLGANTLEALEALGVADVKALQTLGSADEILSYSSKLQFMKELLPALASRGHRTLIFCQSIKMLDLVQLCCLKPNGLRCLRIDGLTNIRDRAEKVKKFNTLPDRFQCMLLTTTTGGVGLNLTGADRVILVDPAWNPAVDAQAVDRAFRIGQTREVKVYRLIMSGLVEDKMFRLQVFKMGITKTALEAEQVARYFSHKEIKKLFEWTEPAECQTREMLLTKHPEGNESAARSAIEDGGFQDGWLASGPSLGLSNFAQLYSGFAKDEDDCEATESTAKVADEALQTLLGEQYDAEHYIEKRIDDDEEEEAYLPSAAALSAATPSAAAFPAAASSAAVSPAALSEPWSCPACTLTNEASATSCSVCGNSK